jgi:hypothetical protein
MTAVGTMVAVGVRAMVGTPDGVIVGRGSKAILVGGIAAVLANCGVQADKMNAAMNSITIPDFRIYVSTPYFASTGFNFWRTSLRKSDCTISGD